MNDHEISPELKKQLESLQNVPERGLQASHAGRENYLAQVRTLKPGQGTSHKPAGKRSTVQRRSWAARLGTIAAVLLVALSSLGGTVYAAQAAQPDDLLYGVKTLTEDIQVSLESDPEEKLDLYVSFASRRLQEIQNQLAAGEEVSDKALALLEKHTQKMLEQAARLEGQGLDKALLQIEANLQKQNQIMAELGREHPQGSPPGLLKAQEKIRERLELVGNGLKEPQKFKDTIKGKSDDHQNGNGQENGNSHKPATPPGQEKKDNRDSNENGNGYGSEDGELIMNGTPDTSRYKGKD